MKHIESAIVAIAIITLTIIALVVEVCVKKERDAEWVYTNTPTELRAAIRECDIARVENLEKGSRVKCEERQ